MAFGRLRRDLERIYKDLGGQEGCELRLVKGSKSMGPLRCQGFFAPSGPRGVLMSADAWHPRTSRPVCLFDLGDLFGLRKATVDFFDEVNDADMDQMTKITLAKPFSITFKIL